MNKINIPIECKLTELETADRLANWNEVRGRVGSVVQLRNGISAKVPGVSAQTIRDLAAAEAECCPSMLIEVDESHEGLGFQIISEKIEMVQTIHSWFPEGDK
jgi:hypothetical protein